MPVPVHNLQPRTSPLRRGAAVFSAVLRLGSMALVASPMVVGCATGSAPGDTEYRQIMNGTIAYPFADETRSLGQNGPEERFIIRSAVGDKEYTIEIPGAARDYDVQVPLADIGESDADVLAGRKPRKLANPLATDKEMTTALPRLDKSRATDTAMMDSAFGVGKNEGPSQAPSYTLGLARINDLFKKHNFEFALVEINNMLAFYANSPQLYKMKGTVLIKMRNFNLAELAWIKALQLDPRDRVVRAALEKLQRRIAAQGSAVDSETLPGPPQPIPKPVGTHLQHPENAVGH